ncbi:MAG: DUF1902 domain-containing protein [Proteobacteria bacterium]|nr:DUF1902 domain-containing protein [Pseudomonadota bacterium]
MSSYIGKLGVPLLVRVDVAFDEDAKVYYATSPNLRGLAVEAETLDELKKEVELCVPALFEMNHSGKPLHAKSRIGYRVYAELPV